MLSVTLNDIVNFCPKSSAFKFSVINTPVKLISRGADLIDQCWLQQPCLLQTAVFNAVSLAV